MTDGGPDRKRWLAFQVADDGSVGEARVLFDAANMRGLGGPDGLVVDQAGNIFATGLERVFVFAPDGTHLGSILPGSLTSNVAWGEDGSTLFITADAACCGCGSARRHRFGNHRTWLIELLVSHPAVLELGNQRHSKGQGTEMKIQMNTILSVRPFSPRASWLRSHGPARGRRGTGQL